MPLNNIIDYYSQEDKITNLGEFKNDLQKIQNVARACDLVNKIMLIDFLVNMKIIKVPAKHKNDVNVRAVEDKLKLLLARKKFSFTDDRKNEEKILGNCRELLLCFVPFFDKIV